MLISRDQKIHETFETFSDLVRGRIVAAFAARTGTFFRARRGINGRDRL